MDMDMGSGSSGFVPLDDAGVDFSNETDAFNFLQDMLDDSYLQVVGNQYARYFWYGVAVLVGVATVCNLACKAIIWARLRAAAANRGNPSKPSNFVTRSVAALTAVAREASYLRLTPLSTGSSVRFPSLGEALLVALYLAFILALQFIDAEYAGAQHNQALGIRAGWLAVAQTPLLILLAGKANIVGYMTGVSYERLHVYHRWTSRGLLLLACMHFGFQSHGWASYGLMQLEWATDTCPPTGMAAFAFVLWMNLSTLAPFRNMSYKFFVAQHILTFVGFIIAIMLHLPPTALYSRVYVWIPIGLYIFDRAVRSLWFFWTNCSPATARVQALEGSAIKITLSNKRVRSWSAGSHARLRFSGRDVWHAHPARLVSTPESHGGDMVFILKARGWTTQRLLARATDIGSSGTSLKAFVGGPYRSSHNDFGVFDSVLLLAGGTGVTFTIGVLLDLAHRAAERCLPVRKIDFVWVVKQQDCLSWVAEEFAMARALLSETGVELRLQMFVTDGDTASAADRELSCVEEEKDTKKVAVDEKAMPGIDSQSDRSVGQGETYVLEEERAAGKDSLGPVEVHRGRPDIARLLLGVVERAKGESAIGLAGPLGLELATRKAVVSLSDARAVSKGSGAQGIYLHVANADYC